MRKSGKTILALSITVAFNLPGMCVHAMTLAGTEIKNTADVVYTVNGTNHPLKSNETVITVEDNTTVSVAKSAAVKDQSGSNIPMSGSTITYTLTITASGNGTATGIVITDPIPANTTYVTGTLKLNGTPLTDAIDADAGDVGGTTAGEVTVGLGDMTGATGTKTITFDVKIN